MYTHIDGLVDASIGKLIDTNLQYLYYLHTMVSNNQILNNISEGYIKYPSNIAISAFKLSISNNKAAPQNRFRRRYL